MSTSVSAMRAARGFSMIELLVTVLLAGIIFAAMVPVFASALKKTSGDNYRVTATNLAADRIEKIRMLQYVDITNTNLNNPAFADNEFGGSFTPVGGGAAYTIDNYTVEDVPSAAPTPTYKKITVTVRRSASDPTWSMFTVVMNPAARVTGATSGATPGVTPSPGSTTGTNYTLVVSVTNATVTSSGVTVVRTDHGLNTVQLPSPQIPDMTNGLTRSWTGLVGGPDVIYRVTVNFRVSGHSAESKNVDVNLIDDTPVYFDTDPYH